MTAQRDMLAPRDIRGTPRRPVLTKVELAVAVAAPPTRIEATTGHASLTKRFLDVVAATLWLIASLPLLALIAPAIKLTSRGPAFFRQIRVGRDGELFEMIKLRTMRTGTHADVLADDEEMAHYLRNDFKLPADDPRITSIGALLRKTSLDELPQLINVIRGQMSLVGIRPVEPIEFAARSRSDQQVYTSMRPGLTGLWQTAGRSGISYKERLDLDRRYVDGWSLWRDVKLLARTPLAVLHIHQTS